MPRPAPTLALLACLVPVLAVHGGPPATPRTDYHGEALPPGAVARCGAVRLHNLHYLGPITFAPGGKVVAVAVPGGPVLYDVASGRAIRRMAGRNGWVNLPGFSADGKVLAAESDEAVSVWDVATGKRLRRFGKPLQRVLAFALSPDGKTLAVQPYTTTNTDLDLLITLWDVATGRESKALVGHGPYAHVLEFSADGRTLTSLNHPYEYEERDKGSGTKKVRRSVAGRIGWWDVVSGKQLAARKLDGRSTLAPDGRTALVRGKDRGIEVRDLRANRLLHTLDTRDALTLFSPNGKVLATAGKDGVVSLWDVPSGRLRRRFPARCPGDEDDPQRFFTLSALSPDGRILASASGVLFEGRFSLWDTASGRELLPRDVHLGPVTCLAFAGDGKTLVSGSRDRTLRRWDVTSGKPLGLLSGHQATVTLAALSPDGTRLASTDADHVLRLWDVRTGRVRATRPLGRTDPTALAFSLNGKRLEVATVEGRLLVCDPGTGKTVRHFRLRRATLWPHTLYDGSHFPWRPNLGDPEPWLNRVLCPEPGRKTRDEDITADLRTIHCLARSPDGKYLATGEVEHQALGAGDYRCYLRVWEVATGAIVFQVESGDGISRPWGTGPPAVLVFSPDGRSLLAGHACTCDIHVWDLAVGKEVKRLQGHEGSVTCLALSPDGKTLASGSEDSTVLLWDVTRLLPPSRDDGRLRLLSARREWKRLGGRDAAAAYRGLWRLVGSPHAAVPLLRDRLRALTPPGTSRILRWVADLDSDSFAVRAKATAELERLGDWAERALDRALEKPPSLEFRRRVEALLDKLAARAPSSARLQMLRGIAVLERIGTPEARAALADVARHAPDTALAQEAGAARDRLTRNKPGR